MSDSEPDEDLLELLRKSLGLNGNEHAPPRIKVLEDAEYVYSNSTDVAIDMRGTKDAATKIQNMMSEKGYSTRVWSLQELHPKAKDSSTVDFIFLMDLLNFSFWSSSLVSDQAYAVEYRGKAWSGYWSLVAAIQRALEDNIPITTPSFWNDGIACSDEMLRNVFRSSTSEQMPMLEERIGCVREAGKVLCDQFGGSFVNLLEEANGSAATVVDFLIKNFPCFNDAHYFEDQTVRFHKRAQILVADLWACFEGESYGFFSDIDQVTMFADYRIPQMLHTLGCISYAPPLESHIRNLKPIENGHPWEIQLRGCSIWCVELIRREILRDHPDRHINAILIDFFLYDTIKEMEARGVGIIPHHRTRSIWY